MSLKRKVFVRVLASFLLSFFPTVIILYWSTSKLIASALTEERDRIYRIIGTLVKEKEGTYLLKPSTNCRSSERHFRLEPDGLYWGRDVRTDEGCFFRGVFLERVLRLMILLEDVHYMILYQKSYVQENFSASDLDTFMKGKLVLDQYVVGGFSSPNLLKIPVNLTGYRVYGSLFEKFLVVEIPLVEASGYPFGKLLLVKDVSTHYINFYGLLVFLVSYSGGFTFVALLLLWSFVEGVVRRIENLRNVALSLKDKDFSALDTLKPSSEGDEIEDLGQAIKEMALHLREAIEELHSMAYHDSLTGLPNRRFFFEHAQILLENAKRYNLPLSLVMLDVDNFKSLNDTYGHQLGDAVLINLANILKSMVRHSDVPARLGGEEFGILLPNTPLEGAVSLAQRIRIAFEGSVVLHNGVEVYTTLSAGVATYTPDVKSLDELIRRADVALYRAKNMGKNRVEVFTP
ncbi:diguanylate cyclase [Thermocrinis albus DSM 14484]|uniref:diguanylate cyclase n=1 Tax=Thermocrinis albus (strain DSM 14484 / JCM 11386 / HI 11/12) TaxID=638303 RepID=D3SMD9_THEAH|nr:diguanylate cyclase [Thermocrinis albus]ADC89919.1 diguanylate cyclase [Thermocrinis albus DSM 14484]